jgi:hypothetical protein
VTDQDDLKNKAEPMDPMVWKVAAIIDWPSVYMGGPSAGAVRRAEVIVKELVTEESVAMRIELGIQKNMIDALKAHVAELEEGDDS